MADAATWKKRVVAWPGEGLTAAEYTKVRHSAAAGRGRVRGERLTPPAAGVTVPR